MSSQSFSRPGAVDLSGLAAAAQTGAPTASSSSTASAAPGSYVVLLDEKNFDAVMRQSMQYPVILELTSAKAHGAAELSQALTELADAAGGAWLLARADIDAQPRIGQAMQVTALPEVLAVIGGQLAPLFQGTRSKADAAAYIQQVMELATANGITGRVQAQAAPPAEAEQAPDPRFADADAALAAGDYAKAVEEFDKLIAQAPNDQEAIAGRAQAALLDRSMKVDPAVVVRDAAVRPDDVRAQFDAADLEVLQGAYAAAFDRLIGLVRDTSGDERDTVRKRLLELFSVVGASDPAVLKARRDLSTALF